MIKSIMWKHIYEEEATLNTLLNSNQVAEFKEKFDLTKICQVVFVASGSSLNVAKASAQLFEKLADTEVRLKTPNHFIENHKGLHMNRETTLVIAISQTGTSSGTIRAIQRAKEQGVKVLTLTERMETPIHDMGDYYLNFLCGLEDCNAKTKGYSNSLVLLWLIALEIGKEKGNVSDHCFAQYMDEIKESIKDISTTIQKTLNWLEAHKDWGKIEHFNVVGYGMNYGTAEEGMLKLMETLCLPATVCEVGEFSHGFHRTLSTKSNVITILTEEFGYEDMLKINSYLAGKIDRFLVMNGTKNYYEDSNYINVEYRPLTASALNIAVVFQTMAVYIPELIGNDPNRPSNEELVKLLAVRV